jgi:hypothetical protein
MLEYLFSPGFRLVSLGFLDVLAGLTLDFS